MKTPAWILTEQRAARYGQLLDTVEWRAFAYRAKEAAGFACQLCRRGDKALEVHHHFYDRDRLPWEYELGEVSVFCGGCHREMHDCLQAFRVHVFGRMNPQAFRVLNGSLAAGLGRWDGLTLCHAFAGMVGTPGAVERFAGVLAERNEKSEREVKE